MSGGIRAVVERDFPNVVALYSRIYPNVTAKALAKRAEYLHLLLFEHPWRASGIPSLVYEDNAGQILGLLGVTPRPMLFKGERIYTAISHNYMVDPAARCSLVAVSLMKSFLCGKQKLSVCQSESQVTRKIMKTFGASAVVLQGLNWVWPLRPVAYLLDRLRERGAAAIPASVSQSVSWLVDRLLRRLITEEQRPTAGQHRGDELSLEQLLECINEYSQSYTLRPEYDLHTLTWLWNVISQKTQYGSLRKRGVWTSDGARVGYYVYCAKPYGVSQVLQIGARAGAFPAVLDVLAKDAMCSRSLALYGWLDARYIEEISAKTLYLKHRRDDHLWTQTRDMCVQATLEKGEAFLTPMESEWWTWYPEPRTL
jgi:hypothetical protein